VFTVRLVHFWYINELDWKRRQAPVAPRRWCYAAASLAAVSLVVVTRGNWTLTSVRERALSREATICEYIRAQGSIEPTGYSPAARSWIRSQVRPGLMSTFDSFPPFDWNTWTVGLDGPGLYDQYDHHHEATSDEFAFIDELWPFLLASQVGVHDTRR
jgi:hypothetical protein